MTSSLVRGHGGRRYSSWAFTEQGVAMLSSVLKSKTAVDLNIEIMRAFVRLRRAALASAQLMPLIEDLSKRVDTHDALIADLVRSIRQFVEGPGKPKARPIGFTADIDSAKKSLSSANQVAFSAGNRRCAKKKVGMSPFATIGAWRRQHRLFY